MDNNDYKLTTCPTSFTGVVVNLVCLALLLSLPAAVYSQAESGNFRLSSHAVTSGGGISSGSSGQLTGILPSTGGGFSAAVDKAVYNGFVSINLGVGGKFLAFYSDLLTDTIDIADQTLKTVYGGGAGEPSGQIYYRYGGQPTYTVETMTTGPGDTLTFDLIADALNCRGLECYFVVSRGDETCQLASPDTPFVLISHTTNATGQRPDSTRPGKYRIVAMPLEIDGPNSADDVFLDDLGSVDPTSWRLGHYNSSLDTVIEYPQTANSTPGQGWWLITREQQTYGAAGYTVRPNRHIDGQGYYEIPLPRGWNQVANPFPFNIDWRDVLLDRNGTIAGIDAGLIDDVPYWYSGTGYFWANTLPAWDGFFVYSRQDDLKMLFPYQEQVRIESRSSMKSLATDDLGADWSLHIAMQSDDLIDEGNFVGVRNSALDGNDRFDMAEPPPPPGAARLAFVLPDAENLYRTDIRPPLEEGATWLMDLTYAEDRRLTVSGIEDLPANLEVVLVFDIGVTKLLEEGDVIEVPFDSRQARLLVGNRAFTSDEVASILPDECQLHQNFPNPFNPITNVRFTIPRASHVLLEVYNLLGQTVITLVNEDRSAGTHTVTWNAHDADGRPVATGVYFYRITIGEFTEVRKMLLLK